MKEFTTKVDKRSYEITFKTTHFHEYKEVQDAIREIMDRNNESSERLKDNSKN